MSRSSYLEPDRSPLTYAPDAPFYLMIVKGAIDHGWFLDNPSLGFPFGQALHEFPQGLDNLNLLVLQVIGWVTGDVFAHRQPVLPAHVRRRVDRRVPRRRAASGSRASPAMVVALLFTFLPLPLHPRHGRTCCSRPTGWCRSPRLLLVQVVSVSPPFTVDADTPRGWRIALAHALVAALAPRVRRPRVHRLVLRGTHDHCSSPWSSSSTTSPGATGARWSPACSRCR